MIGLFWQKCHECGHVSTPECEGHKCHVCGKAKYEKGEPYDSRTKAIESTEILNEQSEWGP